MRRHPRWKWGFLRLIHRSGLLLALVCGGSGHLLATGYFGPGEYLGQGGKNVTGAPEFYWELETKRLARNFHPTEKPFVVAHGPSGESGSDLGPMIKATTDADVTDFANALKSGEIKPPDGSLATQQHTDARNFIAGSPQGTPPAEFDSEFADYHRGALAFKMGADHWEDARKAWEALLNRPASERHYRSTWAAFMLGKLAMKKGDAAAVKWFEMTRELAKQGFADALGLAADSYGWEGRSEWKLDHPERAAPLFLTQLALGDESAVVSLKALVPDRLPVEGMLNYGFAENIQIPYPPPLAGDPQTLARLDAAARDPLLRKLVTAHILATGWAGLEWARQTQTVRSQRWLAAVTAAKPTMIEDAEYLGWLAYSVGDYEQAQRWLRLAKSDSPAARWLQAKLQLRAGNVGAAVKSLAQAIDTLRSPDLYTGWSPGPYKDTDVAAWGDLYIYAEYQTGYGMGSAASGDLGELHLQRGDFVQALDVLFKGGLWGDAAFVAERILTTNELKAYVDKLKMAPADAKSLRNLLGRRLVRDDRYAEAAAYLDAPYDKIVGKYHDWLKEGTNTKLPTAQRARAYFNAAWLARFDGMALMGTEVAPDGFNSSGAFADTDLAAQMLAGQHPESDFTGGQEKSSVVKNPIPTTALERQRLERNKIQPDVRYHYREIAVARAMKAADLLPDNSEELADVVNTAGGWIKNKDEKLGNRIFQVIDRRCSKSKIGAQASAVHWFVDATGPWSTQEALDYKAMHDALGDSRTGNE